MIFACQTLIKFWDTNTTTPPNLFDTSAGPKHLRELHFYTGLATSLAYTGGIYCWGEKDILQAEKEV